jgi:hypothetical protein
MRKCAQFAVPCRPDLRNWKSHRHLGYRVRKISVSGQWQSKFGVNVTQQLARKLTKCKKKKKKKIQISIKNDTRHG